MKLECSSLHCILSKDDAEVVITSRNWNFFILTLLPVKYVNEAKVQVSYHNPPKRGTTILYMDLNNTHYNGKSNRISGAEAGKLTYSINALHAIVVSRSYKIPRSTALIWSMAHCHNAIVLAAYGPRCPQAPAEFRDL